MHGRVTAVRALAGLVGGLLTAGLLAVGATAQSPTPAPVRFRPVGCRVPYSPMPLRGGSSRHEVALTFDDGPWTDTPQFVSTLERLHVQATFFMIGRQITGDSALLTREVRDGDVLGNHTFTHPYLTRTGDAASQLSQTDSVIEHAAGYRPCVFRPPYGDYDAAVVQTARSEGLTAILWNVDPSDYSLPGTSTIVARVLAQVQPGSIILMHDGGGPRTETLAAVPQIVAALRRRGLQPVSLVKLLGGHTVYRRCRQQCGGAGVRGPLPRGSVVQPG